MSEGSSPTSAPGSRSGGRLGRQIIGLAVVSSLVAGGVLVALLAMTASGLATRSADQVLADTSDEAIATVTVDDGRLVVPEASLEPGVVVYDDDGRIVAGTPVPALAERYDDLRSVTGIEHGQVDDTYRLRAAPFDSADGTRGVVVAAMSIRGYEEAENFGLTVAVVAALALVLVATGAAFWVSRQTWRLVSTMALTAEGWSERDLERRFNIGASGHELTVLATTLNGLLDKVSQALGAEQRLTAELAHELRSPLASAQTLTELLSSRPGLDESMREDLSQLSAACSQMGETITTLLDLARHGPPAEGDRTALAAVIDAVVAGVPTDSAVATPGRETLVPFELAGEPDLLVRTLAPLVDNAVRMGARVRISAESDPVSDAVLVHVDDDGPGVVSEVKATIFQPGVSTGQRPGLGLPLARRVARALGGDVFIASAPPGWSTRFTVRLRCEASTLSGAGM